jgi:hypothetical protein
MHMTACRGFIDFVINDKKANDFYAWINDTVIPEEQYFSSIQHNPHLGSPGAYTGQYHAYLVFVSGFQKGRDIKAS